MRYPFLDALRGLAVLWMIIFHSAYDLKLFHFISADFTEGFWYGFPRFIAFTFLFCVGASLYYGHTPKVRWQAMKERSLKLGLAALCVSLATYFIFPSAWIFFGTLHCIFLGSILGALLVNHRRATSIVFIVILMGQYVFHFDIKWVSSIVQKPSMDFIPIYPWFWAILLGMILAPYLAKSTLLNKIPPSRFLTFLGKHSLKIYLIHQPVIFGSIWLISQLL